MVYLAAILALIAWHHGFFTAHERAGREAFSPEATKWASKRFAKPGA
jgi:hypothetical protein